jgi:ribosome-associated protein
MPPRPPTKSRKPAAKGKSKDPKGAKATKSTKSTKAIKPKGTTTARSAALKKRPPVRKTAGATVDTTPRNKVAYAKSQARAHAVAQAALSKKAEHVVLIDVRGLTSIADFFVVMSGTGSRQLQAIAESIEVDLKKQGTYPLSSEGHQGGNWVLIDYGDVVAHIFETEVRAFYDLEGLWADAPREKLEG